MKPQTEIEAVDPQTEAGDALLDQVHGGHSGMSALSASGCTGQQMQ